MVSGRILYATSTIRAAGPGERIPRRQQSEAASGLLCRLGGPQFRPNATSKSHSRAIVAAAAGQADQLSLGIDVEWVCENRPFNAILRFLVPSLTSDVDCQGFYRAWTFIEAYYKAFQEQPDPADVAAILTTSPDDKLLEVSGGVWLMQHRVADVFELCLVWKSSGSCAIEYSSNLSDN
jgi:phosphopantetheinyl transferase